jgi:very-short-patch-repair endonuclease
MDVGPSSLAAAAATLTLADVAWLLVRVKALEPSTADPRRFAESFTKYLKRTGNEKLDPWSSLARAVSGGCESAGEAFVWYLLESLGVGFRTQHHLAVGHDERLHVGSEYIRTDFLLDGDVILEVDSGLHQHVKDVRRDLWNLVEGRRTLRIVGTDVIADPVRAQSQLAKALRALGIPVRPTSLPAWLIAA